MKVRQSKGKRYQKIKKAGRSRVLFSVIGGIMAFFLICCLVGIIFLAFLADTFAEMYRHTEKESATVTNLVDDYLSDNLKQIQDYASGAGKYLEEEELAPGNIKAGDLNFFKEIISWNDNMSDIGMVFFEQPDQNIGTLKINVSDTEFYQQGLDGIYGISCEAVNGTYGIVYTAPIQIHGKDAGFVFAIGNRELDQISYLFSDLSENGVRACYVLNEQNEVIAYCGNASPDYSYNFKKRETLPIQKDYELQVESAQTYLGMDPDNLFSFIGDTEKEDSFHTQNQDVSLKQVMSEEKTIEISNIWYRRNLKTPGFYTWSQAGASLEKNSIIRLMAAGILAVLFFLVPFFLLFFSIISKILSTRRMEVLLFQDSLTGYGNWLWFEESAGRILKKRRNKDTQYAMISFEMNKYRILADYYGGDYAEKVLGQISTKLSREMKYGEVFARYAEAQYAMLLKYEEGKTLTERIMGILTGLSEAVDGKNASFHAGVYLIEDKAVPIGTLNLIAIGAKDSARETKDSQVVMYNEEIRRRILKEKEIEDTMEEAMENHEFKVYLQPKYRPHSKSLAGAEALVRWISPSKGLISPGEFIPIFEKNGFIIKLDDYMLREVSRILAGWIQNAKVLIPISVNISRAHFADVSLAEHICSIVDEYSVPHRLVELELTESAFFDDRQMLLSTVQKLQSYGFEVSMDDFGSGYSSLNSLKDLPLDIIKLDGEFFRDSDDKQRGQTVVRNTITLAKNLNMKIVAEGIETKEQVDFLSGQGCDLIQGFYFARPMPVEEFEKLERVKEDV